MITNKDRLQGFGDRILRVWVVLGFLFLGVCVYLLTNKGVRFAVLHERYASNYADEYYLIMDTTNEVVNEVLEVRTQERLDKIKLSE